ncbi:MULTISPECIES: hypothetical protein [unclassified Spirosoma]|uniref:hypothetical protein n=1 Tax=unclassified Spirosoma TaxID=2621999 RepID=UPI000964AA35|nr:MULTISPECIES: hypothetical protein [unclassified Spirosoma]MBN8824770.1 hypothetical protein [Spirosoma sp.]OJW77073.1 MAG: hypothetical protein BGO59_23810 [Spirosoma sp. 48-14]
MNFSKILLGCLVLLNGGIKIKKISHLPPLCITGEFRFGDLNLPYPATVGQIAKSYHMRFESGTFVKDTSLVQHKPKIYLTLKNEVRKGRFALDSYEGPEDMYERPVLEYQFHVLDKVCSFDSLRSMIEKEAGKTFRTFAAASYSSPSSPWQPLLKGRTVFVYTLRISECMVVNLTNIHQAIPEGIPNAKTDPFTSVNFFLYKTDKEIEQMYEPFEVRNKDLLRRRDSLINSFRKN